MYKFFHNYPVCPNCQAPIIKYTKLRLTNPHTKSFKCENCGAHFFNRYKSNKDIFWEIELNNIEDIYLSFLNENKHDKFLITWPWEDVKFTPILATNYLLNNPDNKVIVVDKFKKDDEFIFSQPSVDVLLNHLYFADEIELRESPIDENLINEEDIFESTKKFYCNVTLIKENLYFYKNMSRMNVSFSEDNWRMEADFEENKLKKFRKDMIEKIESKYSDCAIYSVKNANENRLPKIMNEYGILKLYFNIGEGIKQGVKLSDKFKKDYSKILANFPRIHKVSDYMRSIIISDELDLKNNLNDYNLIFLDDSMDSRRLLSFISKVNADLTIFSRADLFFEQSLIFNKGFEFNNFISATNNTVLLFSTYKDNRGLYKIGDENSPLNGYGIIPHTWDFEEITNSLTPKYEDLSIASSNFSEIKSTNNIPVEYIPVMELNMVEDSFSDIIEFYQSNNVVKSFLRDLIRTPLYLKGYFRDKKVFGKHNMTFESLFATIYNRDEKLGIKLDSIYRSVYTRDKEKFSPLFNKILSLGNDFKLGVNDKIIFVVDFFERKGLKELMELHISDEEILNHFDYSSWDRLSEYKFDESKKYYIVSTRAPYINFKLNNFDFEKIYFVGSDSVIDDLKVEITKRLTDEGTKPIFVLDDDNKSRAPNKLVTSIKNIEHLPKVVTSSSNKLNSKLNYTQDISRKWDVQIRSNNNSKNKYNVSLNSTDDAVLVISKFGEGMFLPLNNNIYIKNKNGGVEEISTSRDSCDDLIHKEIVLDSEGFYTSFRLLFFNFVLESNKKVPIFYKSFQWNDFKSLLADAFDWLELLKKVYKNHYESKTTILGPKYSLANDISKLKLNAKDPGYIYQFWLCDPVYLETSDGNIPIYEKEHPRSGEDLVILYNWINDTFPDINVSTEDALRCYYASIELQRIRRLFLRKKENKLPYSLLELYHDFEKIVDKVLLNADSFEVSHAGIVKLNDNIVPYKVVNDYKQYLE